MTMHRDNTPATNADNAEHTANPRGLTGQGRTTAAAEIAARLSEAQREALLNMRAYFTHRTFSGSPAALHALKRKGLSEGPFADTATPLGLEVRAILLRTPPTTPKG